MIRNPIIDCMVVEFVKEFMSKKDPVCFTDIMDVLPLQHFDLTCDAETELEFYISSIIENLAAEYNYVQDEDDSDVYIPDDSEEDEDEDDDREDEEDEDEYDDEEDNAESDEDYDNENEDYDTFLINTANHIGQLTIPAKFIKEIAEPGEELIYACYGNEVLIFPKTNHKLFKMVKKEEKDGTTTNVISYNPHYTHGYYEVRRTMNDLFEDLEDAAHEEFRIELDTDEGAIHVFRA